MLIKCPTVWGQGPAGLEPEPPLFLFSKKGKEVLGCHQAIWENTEYVHIWIHGKVSFIAFFYTASKVKANIKKNQKSLGKMHP